MVRYPGILVLFVIGVIGLHLSGAAVAYERYLNPTTEEGNCKTCHGNFTDSTTTKNAIFPSDDKHKMHKDNSEMNTECDLCHTNGDDRNPFIGSSDGTANNTGYGCSGCHGRLEDDGNDPGKSGLGAGLRQHHYNNNVTGCSFCHGDANPASYTPVGEDVRPPYYGTADTDADMSCNPDQVAGANENWTIGEFVGLDNDGDLMYDAAADSDCVIGDNRPDNDVTAVADVTGDQVPDVAGFIREETGKPRIVVYSGASGGVDSTFEYINVNWQGIALGTVRDASQDGTADDPAVAMLVENKTTQKIRVETRRLGTGAFLGSIQFLNENWRALDVIVVDDLNGDGISNDTAVAVLAERLSDGRIQVQSRNFVGGSLISNVVYLNARWSAVAAAVVDRSAMVPAGTLPPLIGVIAENPLDGRRLMQSRVAGVGTFDRKIKFLGSAWDYNDISVNHDADGDGTNEDPIWQVLATRASDQVLRVQSRFVSDGALDKNSAILNANWEAFRLDTSPDIDGNSSQEMVISATRRADAVRRIHIKDYASGSTTTNITP